MSLTFIQDITCNSNICTEFKSPHKCLSVAVDCCIVFDTAIEQIATDHGFTSTVYIKNFAYRRKTDHCGASLNKQHYMLPFYGTQQGLSLSAISQTV